MSTDSIAHWISTNKLRSIGRLFSLRSMCVRGQLVLLHLPLPDTARSYKHMPVQALCG